LTIIWAGLSLGALYVLVAIGFNIVYIASGVFNFAHPQFLMLGAFTTYTATTQWHWPIALVFLFSGAVACGLSVAEELFAIRPLAGKGVHGELVTTVGVSVVIQGCVLLIWGSDPLPVHFFGSTSVITVLGGRLLPDDVLLIVCAIALSVGAHVWFSRSRHGLASVATSEDRSAAMARGINVRRLSLGAFAVAGAMAGALGPISGPKTFAVYSVGTVLAIMSFVAISIGGFGNNLGALVGGFAVGLTQEETARWLGSNYATLSVFFLLLIVLFVVPHGLFGQPAERRV
jgi:branched-chain amino acid transport system permease protein